VPQALRALAACDSEETANAAYQRVLYAFGNNHAGTYYPVVLPALPFLGQILTAGTDRARDATLAVLYDPLASFQPEAGYEVVAVSGHAQSDLRALIFRAAAELVICIRPLADDGGSASLWLASELLEIIADGPSPMSGRRRD
jgi:hypothetical protein